MTYLGPIGRLGRYTATPLEHIAAASLELQVIQANPSYRFTSERAQCHAPRARPPQRLAARALTGGCSLPHLRPKPGWWRSSRTSDSRGEPINSTTTEEVER